MEAEVRAQLQALQDAWNSGRTDAFEPLWDLDDARPFYLAEEELEPATDWPALRDYWLRTRKLNEKIRIRFSDIRIKPAGEDAAVALYGMRWTIKLSTYPKALGGENRVMAHFRRKPDGWKLYAYVEAPLAPITYIRRLYEREAEALD